MRLFYEQSSSHSFGKWIIESNRVIGVILHVDLLPELHCFIRRLANGMNCKRMWITIEEW